MELTLEELHNQTLDEIDALEFELDCCNDFPQRLSFASGVVKKLYLLEILKIMILHENELKGADRSEFRDLYRQLSAKVDLVAKALQNGNRLEVEEFVLDILEKIIPYIKDGIKKITIYKKSKQIQISA